MGTRTIVELRIAAPAQRVWQALRESHEIKRWFGWEHPGLDAEITFIFDSSTEVIEEGRALRMPGIHTTFNLTELGAGCSLRVTKAAPPAAASFDEIEEGWITFVHQLRFALERHPGEERRTVYLPAPANVELAAFDALSRDEVGARYELSTAEKISGELWFASENQVGVTVDEAGDGLFVLARNPLQASASAVLTTYGLDDDAFEWLRARWTAWWKQVD